MGYLDLFSSIRILRLVLGNPERIGFEADLHVKQYLTTLCVLGVACNKKDYNYKYGANFQ